MRFEQTKTIKDLDRAIFMIEFAVQTIQPQHDPLRAEMLHHLGTVLGMRSDKTGSMDDINRAITVYDQLIECTTKGTPENGTRLDELSAKLLKRFQRPGSMGDLNRAMEIHEEAMKYIPAEHPLHTRLTVRDELRRESRSSNVCC